MRKKSVPVVIQKNGIVKHFPTLVACAEYLGVTRPTVGTALRKGWKVVGWEIQEDHASRYPGKKTNDKLFEYYPIPKDDTSRVKELFTRKPFSATGMWKEEE